MVIPALRIAKDDLGVSIATNLIQYALHRLVDEDSIGLGFGCK
jgi:hypothetical protein